MQNGYENMMNIKETLASMQNRSAAKSLTDNDEEKYIL